MMKPRTALATIHLILAFVLIVGMIALAFWSGTTISDWPSADPPDDTDRAKLTAYGYVSVNLRPDPLLAAQSNAGRETDYSGLPIELRSHVSLLTSRSLFDEVISDSNLSLRNTQWFRSFKTPWDARSWLERHFHASAIPDSKIIRVWTDPVATRADARQIILDVVNKHIDTQRKIAQNRAMDRAAALNALKTKHEIRIRELSDKQNNLMLRLNLSSVGANHWTTSVEVELNSALAQHGQLIAAAAGARARQELLQAGANDDPNQATELPRAEHELKLANATLEASAKRIESLKAVLGDIAIAMADLLSTQEELTLTRAALRDVRAELDQLAATTAFIPVDWAQYPVVRNGR